MSNQQDHKYRIQVRQQQYKKNLPHSPLGPSIPHSRDTIQYFDIKSKIPHSSRPPPIFFHPHGPQPINYFRKTYEQNTYFQYHQPLRQPPLMSQIPSEHHPPIPPTPPMTVHSKRQPKINEIAPPITQETNTNTGQQSNKKGRQSNKIGQTHRKLRKMRFQTPWKTNNLETNMLTTLRTNEEILEIFGLQTTPEELKFYPEE